MDAKKLTMALMLALLIVFALVLLERSPAHRPPAPRRLPSLPPLSTPLSLNPPTPRPIASRLHPPAPQHPIAPSVATVAAVANATTIINPAAVVLAAAPATDNPFVPLDIVLPKPAFRGTPPDLELTEHIEPPSETNRPPVLMVPPGTANLALHKRVTCSDHNPSAGSPELVTNGDKEPADDSFLQMRRGLQWVQIDLVQPAAISYILVWHAHNAAQIYKCVISQIADDADFTQNVRTVYNNDYENKAGLGLGKHKQYLESFEGRWMPVPGEKARYVRSYSMGSTYSSLNRITEIEVYGVRSGSPGRTPLEILNQILLRIVHGIGENARNR